MQSWFDRCNLCWHAIEVKHVRVLLAYSQHSNCFCYCYQVTMHHCSFFVSANLVQKKNLFHLVQMLANLDAWHWPRWFLLVNESQRSATVHPSSTLSLFYSVVFFFLHMKIRVWKNGSRIELNWIELNIFVIDCCLCNIFNWMLEF